MRKYIIFFVLACILCSFSFFNQNYFTELVDEKLLEYSTVSAPEKIYLHTDKNNYSLNETIWFTSYLVNGVTHEKSDKSWVVYVDLFNANDSLVSQLKLFSNNIVASGDFKIDRTWEPGKYNIRAYTNYMKNGESEYIYSKNIQVLDYLNTNAIEAENTDNEKKANQNNYQQIKPDVGFYPEGGHLVENLRSKVAIEIKGISLNGLSFSGTVYNNRNETIATFKTAEFGLGIFVIRPEPDTKYYAKIDFNGVEYTYSIPDAVSTGHTMGIINQGNYVIVNVSSNKRLGLSNTYLVAHQRGDKVFTKFQTENTSNYTIRIPANQLRDGVMHLTLFDNEGHPVCERLVFVSNNENIMNLAIDKSDDIVNKKSKQTIHLKIENKDSSPVIGKASMAVRDLKAFPNNSNQENIKTYLLLNSDLRGKIVDPGYFFEADFTPKKQYILDLVMLTHGWRRFTWQDLLYKTNRLKFKAEKGLMISGRTKRLTKPYDPVQSTNRLTFFEDNNITQLPQQKSNTKGEFKFGPFIFYDSVQTIIESRLTDFKSKNDADRNVLILLSNAGNEEEKLFRDHKLEFDENKRQQKENFLNVSNYLRSIYFQIDQNVQRLNEVTIIAQLQDEEEKRSEELNSMTDYGFATNRIDVEKDFTDNGQTVFDLLNQLPGVNAFNDSIQIRGGTGLPFLLLDKFPVDVTILSTLQVSDIAFIDVLKGADAALYANSGNGVVAIYTRRGGGIGSRNVKRKPGIIDFTAEGFYSAKKFYSPDYSDSFYNGELDYRTTLHWEPIIDFDSENGKTISFYTSDLDSDYLIEVQGITNSGIPLYATARFSVE